MFDKIKSRLKSLSIFEDNSSEDFEEPSKKPSMHSRRHLGYHRNYLGYPTKKIQIFFYTVFLVLVIILIIKLMSPDNLQNLTQ